MIRIVKASSEDLPRLAQCHRKAFPHALSSAMGQTYLEKMLEWYLMDDRAFIFLLEVEGECVGYCGGMKSDVVGRTGSASSMIQHSYNQAILTFLLRPWLFLHPEMIPKYRLAWRNVMRRVKALLGSKEGVGSSDKPVAESYTGLVVIGVDSREHGKGYGSLLLQEFERLSIELGVRKMALTVKSTNEKAIKSYVRNGWMIAEITGMSTSMVKRLHGE